MIKRNDGQVLKRTLRPLVRGLRNAMWSVVVSYDSQERLAVLTFDDGPSPYTSSLLDILEEYKVHATFFMLGENVERFPAVATKVAERGHAIGNHTYEHTRLVGLPFRIVMREVDRGRASILRATGVRSHLFRPPYGQFDTTSFLAVRLMNYKSVLWSVAGVDWRQDKAGQIVDRVVARIQPGGIILLHDGAPCAKGDRTSDREQTVRATHALLETLLSRGYRFVTIPDMIRSKQTEIRLPFKWAVR